MNRKQPSDGSIPNSYIATKRRGGVEVQIHDDQNMAHQEIDGFIESDGDVLDLDAEIDGDDEINEEFEIAERQHLDYQKHRLDAAKRIQALQRGRKSRKKTLREKKTKAAMEQNHKREVAATRIQSMQRRRSSIKRVEKMRSVKRDHEDIEKWLERENAATKIAAVHRGKQQRRKFQNQRMIENQSKSSGRKESHRPRSRIKPPRVYDYQAPTKGPSNAVQRKKFSPTLERKLLRRNEQNVGISVTIKRDGTGGTKQGGQNGAKKQSNVRQKGKVNHGGKARRAENSRAGNVNKKRLDKRQKLGRKLDFTRDKQIRKEQNNPPSPQARRVHAPGPSASSSQPKLPMHHLKYGQNFPENSDENLFDVNDIELSDTPESEMQAAAEKALEKARNLQREVDALQGKVDQERRIVKNKRVKVKNLNIAIEQSRLQLGEWSKAVSEISKKTAVLRNINQRIQIEGSDAYLKKSYSTLIRDLNEAQGERQRAMTALDLACSVLRHKRRDMSMFRRLSEELGILTSSIDQFEIPPAMLPHYAPYTHSNLLPEIKSSLRKGAGRSMFGRNNNMKMNR